MASPDADVRQSSMSFLLHAVMIGAVPDTVFQVPSDMARMTAELIASSLAAAVESKENGECQPIIGSHFFDWASRNASSCFRWPAVGCDSYCCGSPANGYNGTLPALVPGALLAVPPARAAALAPATVPGAKILRALTDFGGYLVDDTGSRAGGGAFCAEHGVNEEVEELFGYSIRIEKPLTPAQGGALFADLVAIFQALAVVVNNAPGSVGGGGSGRQPPPPPFCP